MHTRLLFIFLWVLGLNQSFAQAPDSIRVPYFSIVSPSEITEMFEASENQFGQALFGASTLGGDVVAPVVMAIGLNGDPYCAANAQDFTGKIVLIPRGVCEFGLKALLAQQQGAVGVMIHNFEDISLNMSAGASGAQVTIPVIMVHKSIGDAMEGALSQGEQVIVAFSNGPYHFGRILGKLSADLNENCQLDAQEPALSNWRITAEGLNKSFSTNTRPDGSFTIYADSTNSPYTISAMPLNYLWEICGNNAVPVAINSGMDTVQVSILANPVIECPQLSVSIGAPILRRCFDNWFFVGLCNNGTKAATDAYVDIQLDSPEFEPIQNASLPYTILSNGLYRFEVGTVDVGACVNFQFSAIVSCEFVEIGQTLCYTAHAYPDTFCIPPGQNWNGSNVSVTGTCENGSISFLLSNTGTAPMPQNANYVVLRNGEKVDDGFFQLSQGGTKPLIYPADGATWRVEATQVPNHPNTNNPSATLEACSSNGSVSTGFVLQFSVFDPSEAVDNACQLVVGSWDPNDKQGFPLGATDAHLILPNTELEYLIRFQNTGTDTAFNIVVRDTLAPQFEVSSVRPGIASAAYTFEIAEGNILIFRFKDIKLVDSFKNEAASHGFIRFKVNQTPDLAWDTKLKNSAAIYFDYNPPVITNISEHKIGAVPHATTGLNELNPANFNPITLSPNPSTPSNELTLQSVVPDGSIWRLINLEGKTLDSGQLLGNKLKFNKQQLSPGSYWIELVHNGKRVGLATWIAQ